MTEKKTGKPRTVRTKKMIEKVRSAVKRNSNRSQRKLAEQYETSKTTIHNDSQHTYRRPWVEGFLKNQSGVG